MFEEDKRVVDNVVKPVNFLSKGSNSTGGPGSNGSSSSDVEQSSCSC